MHTKEPREDPLVEMGYEVRDIDFPKVRLATIIFFVFTGMCAVFGYVMYVNRYWFFALPSPQSTAGMKVPVPGSQFPLIQDNVLDKTDISTLRHRETERMQSAGTNPDGSVHIPVEAAMALVAKRGVPPTHHIVPAVTPANITGPNLVGTPPPTIYGTPNPPRTTVPIGGEAQTSAKPDMSAPAPTPDGAAVSPPTHSPGPIPGTATTTGQ